MQNPFYVKNVPGPERIFRIFVAIGGAFVVYKQSENIYLTLIVASFSLTGFLGFCPIC